MSNGSFWPIHKTLSGAINLGQSGPGSNGSEGALHIPKNFNIPGFFSVGSKTPVGAGGLTPLLRNSRCILQPQPTEFWINKLFINYQLPKERRDDKVQHVI